MGAVLLERASARRTGFEQNGFESQRTRCFPGRSSWLASGGVIASTLAPLPRVSGVIMGLFILIIGLAVLIGGHVFVTRRKQRAEVIARIGEWPYKAIFSLVALLGIALIAWGFALYRDAGPVAVWYPPAWTRHVTVGLMWLASICVVAAYVPGDIKRRLKHPLLVGVKLWAFSHLIANGDLGGIILFGSILAWA